MTRSNRLRVGIEPLDALGTPGPLAGLSLHLEQVPRPHVPPAATGNDHVLGLPATTRSRTGRFSIAFGAPALDDRAEVVIRVVAPDRRYVPRRLAIPVPELQDVLDADAASQLPPFPPPPSRARRPVLFPGSAYGVGAGATAVRGRVTRADGTPVRWARVTATTVATIQVHHPDDSVTNERPVLGHAHGDDRGEFLLFVGQLPAELAVERSEQVQVRVRVSARLAPPVDSPAGSRDDPLWDLPVEHLAATAGTADDPVARGTQEPAGFTAVVSRDVVCHRGRSTRPSVPFVLT